MGNRFNFSLILHEIWGSVCLHARDYIEDVRTEIDRLYTRKTHENITVKKIKAIFKYRKDMDHIQWLTHEKYLLHVTALHFHQRLSISLPHPHTRSVIDMYLDCCDSKAHSVKPLGTN